VPPRQLIERVRVARAVGGQQLGVGEGVETSGPRAPVPRGQPARRVIFFG
jgi:hypothetical protein